MTSLFMGVENEFQLVRDGSAISFEKEWNRLFDRYARPCFRKTPTCIRTHTGGSLYSDGREPETCTSPVLIERGFASKVGQSLYLARKDLVEFIGGDPSLDLVGYSMHWNITRPEIEGLKGKAYAPFYGVPWQMFTLTPLSVGSNLRRKNDNRRIEQLGDHIPGEEQATAFALLYAASVLHEKRPSLLSVAPPGMSKEHEARENLVKGGRSAQVDVATGKGKITMITVQEYLERTHRELREGIAALGTSDEIQLLDDFVRGRKELEIDDRERYNRISTLKQGKSFSALTPELYLDKTAYTGEKGGDDLPTPLAKLFGLLAHQSMPRPMPVDMDRCDVKVTSMEWERVSYAGRRMCGTVSGLQSINMWAEILDHAGDASRVEDAASIVIHDDKEGLYASTVLASEGYPAAETRHYNIPRLKTIDNDGNITPLGHAFVKAYLRAYPENRMDGAAAKTFLEERLAAQKQRQAGNESAAATRRPVGSFDYEIYRILPDLSLALSSGNHDTHVGECRRTAEPTSRSYADSVERMDHPLAPTRREPIMRIRTPPRREGAPFTSQLSAADLGWISRITPEEARTAVEEARADTAARRSLSSYIGPMDVGRGAWLGPSSTTGRDTTEVPIPPNHFAPSASLAVRALESSHPMETITCELSRLDRSAAAADAQTVDAYRRMAETIQNFNGRRHRYTPDITPAAMEHREELRNILARRTETGTGATTGMAGDASTAPADETPEAAALREHDAHIRREELRSLRDYSYRRTYLDSLLFNR